MDTNPASRHAPPCDRAYALRLQAPAAGSRMVCGRLEHIVSGRCLDFNSGSELLAALWHEQERARKHVQTESADTPRLAALPATPNPKV